LNISSTLVTDLSSIAGMNLRTLWLYVMPQNMDYSALDTFTHLQKFGSRDLKAESIRIVSKLDTLQSLLLFSSEVDSLEPFMNMKELGYLHLYDTNLTNLEGISAFKQLNNLEITSNKIDDLSALDGNVTIERLKMCNNPVTDLTPLYHMPALKTVILSPGQEANFTKPVNELPFAVLYSDS
jgi:internalin A